MLRREKDPSTVAVAMRDAFQRRLDGIGVRCRVVSWDDKVRCIVMRDTKSDHGPSSVEFNIDSQRARMVAEGNKSIPANMALRHASNLR
jgi:hypothetical protein